MVKVLLQTLGSFVSAGGGVYLAYLYMSGIEKGSNPLLLIPSFLLIGLGVFLLVKASNAANSVMVKPVVPPQPLSSQGGLENVLKKNNALFKDWAQTTDTKNRLKMLQAADEE